MNGASAPVSVSELERRYRRALAWYPRRWRRVNADALLGTLLDTAEAEGRSEPRRGERMNLAVNGIAARVETVLPRAARDLASTFALVAGLAILLAYFVVQDWSPWDAMVVRASTLPFGPFASAGVLVTGLWVVGAVLLMAGRQRAARWVVLASAPVAAMILSLHPESSIPDLVVLGNPDGKTFGLVIGLSIVVAIGRPRRRRAVPIVGVIGAMVLSSLLLLANRVEPTPFAAPTGMPGGIEPFANYFWNGALAPGVMSAVTLAGILAVALSASRHRSIAVGLAIFTTPWIAVMCAHAFGDLYLPVGGPSVIVDNSWFAATWSAFAGITLLIASFVQPYHPPELSRG